MSDPTKQAFLLIIIAVFIFIVLPALERRTGKNLRGLLFGVKKKKTDQDDVPKKGPVIKNGTRGELTFFVSQLLKFAGKNHMRLVAPGRVEYQGKTALLTALLVAPGGIIGVYCLGFGGDIYPSGKSAPWRQHRNGQDSTFDNPVKICKEQCRFVSEAMKDAGIEGDLKVVTVFTNLKAVLHSCPSDVYTQGGFLQYLRENAALREGSLDVKETALALARLAKTGRGNE